MSAKKSPRLGRRGGKLTSTHISYRRTQSAVKGNGHAHRVAINQIRETPENLQLYRPVDPNDPDIRALADSIAENGVREPLVIFKDYYILSGHRRHVAAKLARLTHVPCRVEPICYEDTDPDEVLRLLREFNRQRIKAVDELLREEVISINPDIAYSALLAHREERSDMSDCDVTTVEMSARKRRKQISDVKSEMVAAVLAVIEDRRKLWPLSDRQVHYCLLNNPPNRNTKRRGSRYANDLTSYKDLSDLLTRMRLTGEVPWGAISDETRPVTHWAVYANAQDFIRQEVDGLFTGYARDLQRTQPCHIEIVAEKLTVRSIVERVASRYSLPVTIGRGYCSIMPRYEMSQRYRRSGKDTLVVLVLSDHDPDGEGIAESFARSMRDDFHITNIKPIRVALTPDQVKELGLQTDMQAKRSSSRYEKFVAKHGTDVYELEAVEPDNLQGLLAEAISAVIEPETWDSAREDERTDAGFLEAARKCACTALAGMRGEDSDDS